MPDSLSSHHSTDPAHLYELLVSELTDFAVFLTDPAGCLTSWNPGVEHLLGYPENEWVGQPSQMIFTPEDRTTGKPEEEMAKAVRDGRAPDIRWHQRKDGSRLFVDGVMVALRDEAGQVLGFAKVIRDITERKRAETRQTFLLSLSDQLRALTDPRAIMEAVVEAIGRHLGANRVGYGQVQPDDKTIVLETSYADGVQPLTGVFPLAGFGEENIARQRQGITVVQSDVTLDPSNNLATWAAIETRSFVSVPLIRDGRFRAGFYVNQREARSWSPEEVALIEDVAARIWEAVQRVLAEQELRRQWRTFDTALSGMPDTISTFDLSGRYTYANQTLRAVLQKPFEELAGKNVAEIGLPPDLAETLTRQMQQVIATGQPLRDETPFSSPSGKTRYHEYIFSPIIGPDGRVEGLVNLGRDITQRKQAEAAQRESEARFRFLSGLDDATRPLTDPHDITQTAARLLGEHLQVNRCAYATIEEDKDTFHLTGDYNRDVESIVGHYTLSQFGEEFARLTRAGVPYVVEDTEEDPRAAEILESYRQTRIRSVISVALHKAGRLVAGMAVHQTTPRQWRTEEVELVQQVANRCWESIERARVTTELRESEARFRNLADHAPVMVWVTEADGYCTYLNRQWYEFTAQKEQDALGFGWLDATHPDDKAEAERLFREANLRHESFRAEYRLRRHDGEYRWAIDAAAPRFGPDGTYLGYVGSVIDITERKHMEEALRDSEARFRQLANAVPAFVWVTDSDGQLSYFNERWYAYTGLTLEQSSGTNWVTAMHPDDVKSVLGVWQEARTREAPYQATVRYRSAAGDYRWFMARALPVRDAAGRITQWFGTSTDIDEAKQTEEALRKANRELEEFAYVASHDLQEPLRTVNIYTQLLLKRSLGEDAEAQTYAGFIRHSVTRMEQLIRDLLSYSRIIHTDGSPTGTADLSESLAQAQQALTGRIKELGADVQTGPMPVVRGDTLQLAQVFQNLVSNALKYRKPERPPEIRISAQRDGEQWIIAVHDNGIGFDPMYAERIFGLFKRLHKDEYPGTGLGLAICQRIVERYGGRMWAEGRPGEGATFYFALTATDAA